MTDIEILFGAPCKSIKEQLENQGFTISDHDSKQLQSFADAITLLKIHSIISEKDADKAQQKVFNMIFNLDSFMEREE